MSEIKITLSDHAQEALQQFAERQNISVDPVIDDVSTMINNVPDGMFLSEYFYSLSQENQTLKKYIKKSANSYNPITVS